MTAIPSSRYSFVSWSDDRADNPRLDTNLHGSLSVVAFFNVDVLPPSNVTADVGDDLSWGRVDKAEIHPPDLG